MVWTLEKIALMSLIYLRRSYSCVWKTRPKSRPREHVIRGTEVPPNLSPSKLLVAEFCGVAGLTPTGFLALSSTEWSAPTWGRAIIGKDRRGWRVGGR